MRVKASSIRGFIRDLAAEATAASASFSDTLTAAARSAREGATRGKVLIGTASGGTSATFTLTPPGDWTATDIAEVLSDIEDKAEAIKETDEDIEDDDLIAQLKAAYPTVKSLSSDFSGLQH